MAFRDDMGPPVPDMVKQFVIYFYTHIKEQNVPEITTMYEITFPKISAQLFPNTPWPPAAAIADLVDGDEVFCTLYSELTFRHLYARCQVRLEDRQASWNNYCQLFGLILKCKLKLRLPNSWLWDMVDEFIYQFQSFAHARGKLVSNSKHPDEVDHIRELDAKSVWGVLDVLNFLQALAKASGIAEELANHGDELIMSEGLSANRPSNVLIMVGYFALIGLCRVHVLIGDYHTALKALAPLNPFQPRGLFIGNAKMAGANITLYYYAGFSYLMMRRYLDAAKCYNRILMYIARTKAMHSRSAAYDQILKKNEQMFALLAAAVALCPPAQRLLDDNVLNLLREKYADQIAKMARGDESLMDQLFSYGCPKFITPTMPAYTQPNMNANQEAYRNQLRLFLTEIRQMKALPMLKQYLKLYTSIPLPKLAGLMDTDDASLRAQLTCLKSKSTIMRWAGGNDATSGELTNISDIEFHLDVDPETGVEMVVVAEAKPVRRTVEFLGRHISKFVQIVKDLEAMSTAAPAAAEGAAAPAAAAAKVEAAY